MMVSLTIYYSKMDVQALGTLHRAFGEERKLYLHDKATNKELLTWAAGHVENNHKEGWIAQYVALTKDGGTPTVIWRRGDRQISTSEFLWLH